MKKASSRFFRIIVNPMTIPREGVLKFNCHWTKMAPDHAWPCDTLNTMRTQLIAKGLIGVDADGIGFGNVSLRIPQTDDFIITGTQTGHLAELKPEQFTRVVKFDLEKNRLDCQGPIRASSESMTHALIYRNFKRVQNVIHIHHPEMWQKYKHVLPTTSEQAAYGTPEMARAISNLLSDHNVFKGKSIVMGGHKDGLIFIGENFDDAIQALMHYFKPWIT